MVYVWRNQSIMKKLLLLFLLPTLFFVTTEVSSQAVYITNTGSKYHKSGCQYLAKSKIETTTSETKASGYTSCSRCSGGKATKSYSGSTSSQCTGTTKAGSRCKRKTTSVPVVGVINN